jgi:hypothetical protein
MGDAPAVAVGTGGDGLPADAGRAGVLDGAGQQHAAAVPGGTRDPRRARPPQALGPGALGPVGSWRIPRRGCVVPAHTGVVDAVSQEMTRAVNVVSVAPPVFSEDNRSGC